MSMKGKSLVVGSAKVERDLAKVKKYKEMPNKVSSPLSNPYSIDKYMNVLENLDIVSNASYIKALEKIKDLE
ncbi:hypothetical protein NC651_030594 [Populus alba x Populus x berolinensis]|nr:hypothetical protein NC651_030594 [Populus alba x Populus x berolinensis]